MPYQSDQQRKYMHSQHPDIAAKWDEETRKAKEQATAPMSDEQLARAHDRQTKFSLTGSALGLTGLGLLGASAAVKKKPNVPHHISAAKAEQVRRWGTNTSITAGGVGALSGINFARIQNEESRRTREIKKSNYGAGYSTLYSDPVEVDSVPVRQKVSDPDWRRKAPYTISHKAADPERSRERRAKTYPFVMGAGAGGAGVVAVNEARKQKKPPTKFFDKKILNSKTLRAGVPAAAAAGLAAGAVYNSKENNRRSYEDEWYPQRERN
jgi:hypothetical protein